MSKKTSDIVKKVVNCYMSKKTSDIVKKIVMLRNLLFIFYDLPIDETLVTVGDDKIKYFRFGGLNYEMKKYYLLNRTVDIERTFDRAILFNNKSESISKNNLMELNAIYKIVKNDKKVIEYIKKNGEIN